MPSGARQLKQAARELRDLQRKQAKSVWKVAALRGRVEKRSRKVQKLEAKIARQERRVHELRSLAGPFEAGLRPARLIINASSGSFAERIGSPENLVDRLRAHGIQAQVYLKTSGKAVRRWVREAVAQQEELVIVAGGDGTIEDVALALVGSRTALGIIPAGTMNNLARALGIPLDIEQACALVGTGLTRLIDVGCVRSAVKPRRAYFMETAGLGLAIALPAGQDLEKGLWGKLPAVIRKIFDLGAAPAQIELDDGQTIDTHVKLVTISNAPLTGLNNLIAPDAKMDDGWLDLAVYDGLNDVELAEYFLSTAHGQRVSNPKVRFYRARCVHIRATQALPATLDKAEIPDQMELQIKVIPGAIQMIVGQGEALTWPVDALLWEREAEPAKPDQAAEKEVGKPEGTAAAVQRAEISR